MRATRNSGSAGALQEMRTKEGHPPRFLLPTPLPAFRTGLLPFAALHLGKESLWETTLSTKPLAFDNFRTYKNSATSNSVSARGLILI